MGQKIALPFWFETKRNRFATRMDLFVWALTGHGHQSLRNQAAWVGVPRSRKVEHIKTIMVHFYRGMMR